MSNHNTGNVNTNGAARRVSNAATNGADQRVTTSDPTSAKEEKEARSIEVQIRLVNGDKLSVVAHGEELVWDLKQKVRPIPLVLDTTRHS